MIDANGTTNFSSIGFTDEGVTVELTSTGTGLASIKLTRKVNGLNQTLSSVLNAGGGNQVISRIRFFNFNSGSGNAANMFVNNMVACIATPGCPANITVNNTTNVCGAAVC